MYGYSGILQNNVAKLGSSRASIRQAARRGAATGPRGGRRRPEEESLNPHGRGSVPHLHPVAVVEDLELKRRLGEGEILVDPKGIGPRGVE